MSVNTAITLEQLEKELCKIVSQYFNQLWCGIDCNNDYLENKMYRLYDYIWMMRNNVCDNSNELICIIKNNK